MSLAGMVLGAGVNRRAAIGVTEIAGGCASGETFSRGLGGGVLPALLKKADISPEDCGGCDVGVCGAGTAPPVCGGDTTCPGKAHCSD